MPPYVRRSSRRSRSKGVSNILTINVATQVHTLLRQRDSILVTQGSKRLKSMLKSLYCLICSSLACDVTQDDPGPSKAETGLRLKFEDTVTLSRILFEELSDRLSLSLPEKSTDRDALQAVSYFDARDSVEELLLLLKCCVLMVRLHPNDINLMKEFQDAFALLHLLPSRETLARLQRRYFSCTQVISSQSMFGRHSSICDGFSARSSHSYLRLSKRMLEVFLDEMFADKSLRECIATLYYFSSKEGNLSKFSSMHIETVLDVVAAHFLLSVSGDQTLAAFTQSLIWTQKETPNTPELSLTASISWVKHPLMSSSLLLHAHLISLVSDVIGVTAFSEVVSNVKCTAIYLSAFHDSVMLYCGKLSKLLMDSCSNINEREICHWRPVETLSYSEVYDKVNTVLADWERSWRVHINSKVTKTDSSFTSDAISYLKMNLNIFDESNRDDMFSILSSIVRIISTEVDEVLVCRIKEMTVQDFCQLASILKFMSCSMLQAVCCLKENLCLKSSSSKKDAYEGCRSLIGIMSCFGQYNLHLPIQVQQLIVDALKPRHSLYGDTNKILMHFAGLLSLCTATGLDFLVKGCLFILMVFMNVLLFEDRTSEFQKSSNSSGPESQAHACSPASVASVFTCTGLEDPFGTTGESHVRQMSIRRVASDFRRLRQMFISQTAKTRNGVPYLKTFTNDPDVIAEFADFIECKVEKDYTAYMINRATLRHRKSIKNARRRWERKKKMCNSIGKGSRRKAGQGLKNRNIGCIKSNLNVE